MAVPLASVAVKSYAPCEDSPNIWSEFIIDSIVVTR